MAQIDVPANREVLMSPSINFQRCCGSTIGYVSQRSTKVGRYGQMILTSERPVIAFSTTGFELNWNKMTLQIQKIKVSSLVEILPTTFIL